METCSECQKAQRERGQADLLNELEQLNEKFYKEEMSKLHIPMKNRIPYQWTTYGGWISAKRAAIRKPGEKP